jgi:hypothetical protein
MGGACSSEDGGVRRVRGFGGGNPRERKHMGDPRVDGRIFKKYDAGVWTGLSWLRIETGSGYL